MATHRVPFLAALGLAFALAGTVAGVNATAVNSVETIQTTSAVIQPGTADFRALATFLGAAKIAGAPGSSLYDLHASDSAFNVQHIRTSKTRAGAASVTAPNPPTALPDNGSPGDVYKVGHCSRLTQQTWTFTWGQIAQGNWGWICTSYATSMVVRCPAEPGPL